MLFDFPALLNGSNLGPNAGVAVALLVGAPILFGGTLILINRALYSWAMKYATREVPAQGPAGKGVLLSLALHGIAAAVAFRALEIPMAWLAWQSGVFAGIGYCYWSLVCLTESGRRYMISQLVSSNPGICPSQITARYNRHQIISNRVARLTQWGALVSDGSRFRTTRSMILYAAHFVSAWARMLGFEWARSRPGSDPNINKSTHTP